MPPRAHASNLASRPIRLQAPTPGSQSSVAAGAPVGQQRRRPGPEEALSPQAELGDRQGAGELPAVLAPPPTGTGKGWGVVRPERCLRAEGRVSRVPTRAGPCSAGRPVRTRGPSGGSVRPGPQAARTLSPSPLSSLGGRCSPQPSCPGGGTSQLRGRACQAPGLRPGLLWNLIYLNTHTQIFTAGL